MNEWLMWSVYQWCKASFVVYTSKESDFTDWINFEVEEFCSAFSQFFILEDTDSLKGKENTGNKNENNFKVVYQRTDALAVFERVWSSKFTAHSKTAVPGSGGWLMVKGHHGQ